MNIVKEPSTALAVQTFSSANVLMDGALFDRLERMANMMASGKTALPAHFRNSPGDCFAIVLQATQWNMNPLAVAQKTHLINGTLGYEAQLVSAVINSSGVVKDRFHFDWFGPWEKIVGKFKEVESRTKMDDNGKPKKFIVPDWDQKDEHGLGVKVWATLKGETEPRVLTLLLTQARTRNSTLWTEDPKQQLAYLAQKRWARLYAPDVILGVYSTDEIAPPTEIHMGEAEVVGSPAAAPAPATGRPELPPYDQAKFEHNLSKTWKKRIEDGGKPEDLLALLQTRNTLTPEQIKTIRDLAVTDVQPTGEVQAPAPAPAPQTEADDNGWAEFRKSND